MKQIADLAGVSTATVSRALRNQDVVDVKTRQRIMDLANRLQYRPNQLVHGVIQGKIRLVAIVIGNSEAESTSRLISEIQAHLFSNGYSTVLYNTDQDIEREIECLHNAVEYRVSGMIVSTVNYNAGEKHFWELREHGTPFVLLSAYGESVKAPHVHLDDEAVSRKALLYLVEEMGHRDILILAGPEASWGNSLFGDWGRLMQEYGIDNVKERFVASLWDMKSGYESMKRVLESGRRPSAIVGITDDVAAGAMRAIRECGLSVPEDISVMGFGNYRYGEVLTPRLTTVDTGYREVARKSAETLLKLMKKSRSGEDGGEISGEGFGQTVQGSVIHRESVARMTELKKI
ncbi:LacI family DNA-binding transcriptional regulator [Puniceicoccus vermicola]|uniref:LacI family DNA-binding transcriptional regulator n=1 Tax=Puniceicoccus vermicola TaxID=388746 RepID=A0A7X1B2Q7_9BACT|nr:LacI family DNA-binding transcriptional regulator [Puniceicoccus vermicola]MBC2604427.1 LacI family DNA-binding transcriptional regulator [Puniceicoccus vermicola]